MKKIIKNIFSLFGLAIVRKIKTPLPIAEAASIPYQDFADISEKSKKIYSEISPYTLITLERTDAIITSIDYLCANNIPGDIVECGIWKGGSICAAIKALVLNNSFERKIYLFDAFDVDVMFSSKSEIPEDKSFDGKTCEELLNEGGLAKENYSYQLQGVIDLLKTTGYPMENIIFKIGLVENTLPCNEIEKIALLRLDTDWYDSTKHELIHLFPKITKNGVLLIDDYGYWQGCRKAVDDYIKDHSLSILLHRTDHTGRSAIKCE